MQLTGLLIGASAFIVIGICHPIVIKCEYYFTDKIWPIFLVSGLIFCGASSLIDNSVASAIVAVVGFSMLWSILELKEQTKRVKRGWFPENPNRRKQEQAALRSKKEHQL